MSEIEDIGSYDAIVIGSGMSGLMAGNALVKKGYRVLMLEKHAVPGGCTMNFERGDFRGVVDGYEDYLDAYLVERIGLDVDSEITWVWLPVDGRFHDGLARPSRARVSERHVRPAASISVSTISDGSEDLSVTVSRRC